MGSFLLTSRHSRIVKPKWSFRTSSISSSSSSRITASPSCGLANIRKRRFAAASSFFAVDRFASYRKDWSRDYAKGVVIADRYTTSNAVHQCSKLPRQQWESFLDWLFDFEYNKLGIPVPDCVIYLNVDPQVSQALMTARYSGDESKKDIHERDLAYLKHSREAAQYCAEKLGWLTVDCCRDGQMLPIEEIHKRIMLLVEKYI